MQILLTYIIIGFSLSMDAFSVSILLGTIINKINAKIFILFVGLLHFIMPILGALIGYKINNIIILSGNYILGIILLILGIQVLISFFKEEKLDIKFSIYTLLTLAMGVSLDSFSVGFGLVFENINIILGAIIFSLFSMTFTVLGLLLGKYNNKYLGIYSKLIGATLLLVLGICQIFL